MPVIGIGRAGWRPKLPRLGKRLTNQKASLGGTPVRSCDFQSFQTIQVAEQNPARQQDKHYDEDEFCTFSNDADGDLRRVD